MAGCSGNRKKRKTRVEVGSNPDHEESSLKAVCTQLSDDPDKEKWISLVGAKSKEQGTNKHGVPRTVRTRETKKPRFCTLQMRPEVDNLADSRAAATKRGNAVSSERT